MQMPNVQTFGLVLFSTLVATIILLANCQPESSTTDLDEGEALARVYCVSCHIYPDPERLDRSTWENYVLPRMGYLYGIYETPEERRQLFEEGIGGQAVVQENVFPAKPKLDSDIWKKIKAFYLANAPERLKLPPHPEPGNAASLFTVKESPVRLSPPSVTLAKFTEDGSCYIGDANTQALYRFNNRLEFQQAAKVEEGAVSLESLPDRLLVTVMGSFSPTDAPSGMLLELPLSASEKPRRLIRNLQRPVHTARADLNLDGLEDYVISEFAKWTGSLSWWEQLPDGAFRRRMLRDTPGAISTHVDDIDQDGLPDIIALFGQGDEGISIFFNKSGGQFVEDRVIRFLSTNGSASMRLVDHNDDGKLDILYCNGDNADYPPILKPYHGVHLFEQTTNGQFEEVFFYPLFGAYGAVLEDFDLDGDLDVAAISFFPDYRQYPDEGFVLLRNQGEYAFKPEILLPAEKGRWIVMDSGDPDQDGDIDLLLGAMTFEVVPPVGLIEKWVAGGLPFVFLENQTNP